MNIVAVLSWYNERPSDLTRLVASLPTAGIRHLVALDGAYALFPGGTAASPHSNYYALHTAAAQAGVTLTVHTPDTPWQGNEIEKRARLFELAEQVTTAADWYMVVDGDEQIHTAPTDLTDRLDGSPFDVAECTMHDHAPGHHAPRTFPLPMLFRAIRGLTVQTNHYTYRTPDGRNLWGNAKTMRLEPRIPIPDLTVNHYTKHREPPRRRAAQAYYDTRDAHRIERDRFTPAA